MSLLDDVEKVLISEAEIQERIANLAAEMNALYSDADRPVLICILKGAFMFLADLTRHLTFRHELDFMEISSYGRGTTSTGAVRILLDLATDVQGRNVIIVEDIVDTGNTLTYILRNFAARKPASVRVATLLSKPSRRQIEVPVDFIGFEVPDEFVIGYGLDFAEQYRNLPFIGVLKPEVYQRS
ncbi:MAG TPA: hypoxanthine phosphoribosyltransferase [Anaerolineae bacterium]|nr:hypoxanthine phosphoribosyltransferase [Anaerolineae bacterium]HQK15353.1 hypoxanthine phosphoribosyltransferase [Anaerolineae bacterium]